MAEQLPQPCENRREKHVSTEGPHKKDGPGALPADAEDTSRAGESSERCLHDRSGPVKGQGSTQQWSLHNTERQSSMAALSDKLSLLIHLGNRACPAWAVVPVPQDRCQSPSYLSGGTKLEAAIRF